MSNKNYEEFLIISLTRRKLHATLAFKRHERGTREGERRPIMIILEGWLVLWHQEVIQFFVQSLVLKEIMTFSA